MTAKQNILLLILILLGGLFLVLTANAQSTVSSVNSIEISPTQIITSVACNACVGGTPTGKVDTNGCKVYSCPTQPCPYYSPPPPGWCSDGTIVPQPKDENGCAVPAKCIYSQCSSDSDCMETVCPNGGFIHEKCSSGQCVFISKCPEVEDKCSSDSDCMELVCPNGGFVHEKCSSGQCVLTSKCPAQTCPMPICKDGFNPFDTGKVDTNGCKVYSCPTKPCPVGCTCSGDVTTCPVEGIKPIEAKISSSESGVKSVSIEKAPNGLSLKSEKATAIITEKLIIEENNLFLKTSTGNKEIKILPEEASSRVTAVTEVSAIELREESQQPIYFIKGTKQAKLLFVIPISMQIEAKVSAESGNVISVKKPWWSFLAW